MRKQPLLLLAAGLATLAGSVPASAQDADAGRLKAAIVYNILRFVDFPPQSAGPVLNLCVRRGVANASALSALGGRTVGSRAISVQVTDVTAGAGRCDIVYLGTAAAPDVAKVKEHGVLTIGDGASFVRSGGTIGLVTTGKQVRFEVSTRAARQAGIGISSQVLRLAARVEQ